MSYIYDYSDVVTTELNRARVHSASGKLTSWNCPLSNWFAAPTLKGVVRHVGKLHAHEAGFRVCCGVSGCPRTYTKFHSYRKHMYVHPGKNWTLMHQMIQQASLLKMMGSVLHLLQAQKTQSSRWYYFVKERGCYVPS